MAPLVLLFIALAYSDFLYTRFMLRRHGLEIELNPLIRYLAQRFGLDTGILVGIAVPTITLTLIGINFRPILDTLVFARLMLFMLQANHLRTELAPHRSRQSSASR